jgi:uroporphyrinogen decarboxylase
VSITAKENLLRAIAHDRPDHVPYGPRLNSAEGMQVVFFKGDLAPASGLDLWGTRWESTHRDLMAYIAGHPVNDFEELLRYPFPDPRQPGLFDVVRETMDKAHCLVMGHHQDCPFTRYWALFGMENALMAMVTNPDEVAGFLQRLADWNIVIADGYLDAGVEAGRLSDDYGSQRGLLISPALWRKIVKPALERIAAHYKRAGCLLFLHSCGCIMSIVDDLVEIGIDVFNIQATANDLPALKRRFGRKITFQGGVPSRILNLGTVDEVRQATVEAITMLGADGGLILEPDQTIVIPQENVQAFVETAREYGKYPVR